MSTSTLRERAEERAAAMRSRDLAPRSPDETARLLEELNVHQIELEMQNEELRRAQVELEISRARYFDLYDLAPVGYVTLSELGLILEANLTAATLLGAARGALVKWPLVQFILPADQDIFYHRRKMLFETGEPQACELRMVRPAAPGGAFWARLQATRVDAAPGAAGGGPAWRVTINDITEPKRVEEAQRVSEARYRAVAQTAHDAIISADSAGNIVGWNQGAEGIFGYAEAAAMGQPLTLLMLQSYGDRHLAGMQRLLAGGEPHIIGKTVELIGLRKDGSTFPLELSLSEWQVAEEKHFTGIIRDITEHKRAEERLAQTVANLERSNTDLERFAYVVSHDLQEPLRMVASYVQLLATNYQGRLDADADEFIGYAVDGAKRMQQLLLDLVEYSRVSTRGASRQPTDTTTVCRGAIKNLEVAIAERDATVTCDPLPIVNADGSQLNQLFQNLIANAIKFHGAEPPHVHISARLVADDAEVRGSGGAEVRGRNPPSSPAPLLRVSASPNPGRSASWRFAVRDNGIGIDPAHFERVFVIFQRLHTQEEYPGTGIGLAVCQRIVERHGGRIWVESAPGQGSTFYFTVPADDVDL